MCAYLRRGRLGLLGVREHVRLEVGGLGKALAAVVKGTDVWPVASMDPDVRAQVEVQREALATALKSALQSGNQKCNIIALLILK